jgi:hypothetical protein
MAKIPLGLRLDPDLVGRIDADRGDLSRAAWITAACESALRRGVDAAPSGVQAVRSQVRVAPSPAMDRQARLNKAKGL